MTRAELFQLIEGLRATNTDSLHIEAKRAETQLPSRLWEVLSAFSNTPGGGALILGLNESSGFDVTGIREPARIQQELASLCDQMNPPVRALIDLHTLDGQTLIVAEVPEVELGQKPCYYPGAGLTNGAFVRVADGNRRLSPYEVQMMLSSRGQPRDDEEAVAEAKVEDLDPELTAGLVERLRQDEATPFRRLGDEETLRTLRVLVPSGNAWVPSLGGILALGAYPQRFFPSLGVTFVAYPTDEIGRPGPGGERFLDNRRFDGPIPRMVEPVLAALRRNMSRRAVVRGAFREDRWEYPEVALREALVNALAHRDLSPAARGAAVQIHLFPGRLVVANPGGLFGPARLDRLGKEGMSSTRNQVLMKLLEDTPLPGGGRVVAENRGSGIAAMVAALTGAGLPLPVLSDQIASFRVEFQAMAASRRTGSRGQAGILALLKERGDMSRADLATATGMADITVRKQLAALRQTGMVELTTLRSRSRRARYRLSGQKDGPSQRDSEHVGDHDNDHDT